MIPVSFTFHAFAEIPRADWLALLNHPAVIRHMPLTDGTWTAAMVVDWVKGKDEQWRLNGYGPWAIRIDGVFAGWGGYQKEEDHADLALVLHPAFWGYGARLCRALLQCRAKLGISTTSILLPPSRSRLKGIVRLGFTPDGEVDYEGQRFQRFILK
jgi:GNAT superfamily N-acetyltransferase